MLAILTDAGTPRPAPLALLPAERLCRHHLERQPRDVLALVDDGGAGGTALLEAGARDVEERRQQALALAQQERQPVLLRRAWHVDHCVHGLADPALLSSGLQGSGHFTA